VLDGFFHLFLFFLHESESFLGCPNDGHGGSLFDSTENVVELGLGDPEGRSGRGVRSFGGLIPRQPGHCTRQRRLLGLVRFDRALSLVRRDFNGSRVRY
jgi:hypothetical protein